MKLRCKQGDWAIIVKSIAGNEGKIVRCVRLASPQERDNVNGYKPHRAGPGWIIDRYLPSLLIWGDGRKESGGPINIIADSCLCPLPPSQENDSAVNETEKERVA